MNLRQTIANSVRLSPKAFFLVVASWVLVLMRLAFPPSFFPDYQSYLQLYDQFLGGADVLVVEPATQFLFWIASRVTYNPESGLMLVYWLNLASCVALLVSVSAVGRVSAAGLMISTVVYGPLLCYVLLRGGVAYLLVALAALLADQRIWLSLSLCAAAVFFHITAAIPLAILLLVLLSMSGRAARQFTLPARALELVVLGSLLIAWISVTTGWRVAAVGFEGFLLSFDIFSKYSVYLENSTGSLPHAIYSSILLVVYIYMLNKRSAPAVFHLFCSVILLLYATMIIAGMQVAAYRLSIFAALPFVLSLRLFFVGSQHLYVLLCLLFSVALCFVGEHLVVYPS